MSDWTDGVPWAIGGGSAIPAETLRLLAWISLGGVEGVFSTGDCRVDALPVPGTAIRMLPGACAIGNRALNASKEMYIGRTYSEVELDIPPTDGTGGRSDLIIARVENPNISGEPWGYPEDIADGPYIFTRRIANVSPAVTKLTDLNLGYSGITLARIDIPPSTGTITLSMIKDLRTLVNPVTGTEPPEDGGDEDENECTHHCPGGDGDDGDNDDGDGCAFNQTSYLNWPFTAQIDIRIPAWATHADVSAIVQNAQVRHVTGSSPLLGFIRLLLGSLALEQQPFAANSSGRQDLQWAVRNLPIPVELRGTTQRWKLQVKMNAAQAVGLLLSTFSTKIRFDFKFKRRPTNET